MNKYHTTIGLEIHAELATNSKMFCSCKNDPDETKPNVNICPVCMAHPGTLPVANKKAVENVIKVGLAIGGNIANFTEFDRKNYFYPDIPKAYQISQYKNPIVTGGELAGVKITRIHLEEDTANSKHEGNFSYIDFNRAGVPLMEMVTEPCIHDPQSAYDFAREFQLLLQYLGVSHANMEKGEMRVELNISISPDKDKFGTKVEVKNINSFSAMFRAAKFEIARMSALYEAGKESEIVQETRGWDEVKQATFSQRTKENSEDYRYFPDPDLPKLYLKEIFDFDKIKSEIPELPAQKRERYTNDFGIKNEDIETYINDRKLAVWFEDIANTLKEKQLIQTASNYITSDFLGLRKNNAETKMPSATNFAKLIEMVTSEVISSRGAKDILAMIVVNDGDPEIIAKEKNMLQTNDEESIKSIVLKIISENPDVVATYKSGKENAIMALVGKVIKESNGSANPQVVIKLLKENI